MKYLVFDTETTGLPKTRNKIGNWWDTYPNIVQLSWILYDTEKKSLKTFGNDIIKLGKGIIIPEESIAVHKITNNVMLKLGINIIDSINNFIKAYKECDLLIAHNLEFDKNMLISEMIRNNIEPVFNIYNKEEYCTMKENIDFCKLERVGRYGRTYNKYPKLEELHDKLFNNETPKDLHNAINDVLVCLRCFIYQQNKTDARKECNGVITRMYKEIYK